MLELSEEMLDLFDLPPDPALYYGLADDEIAIDCFAGGGGASLGIEWAIGRSPDDAINHSAPALAIHAANHPATRHHHSDVWEIDPVDVARGRRVGLQWMSPDCTHFSRAKGGKPVSKKIRVLAHVAVRYAKAVRPRVIFIENVEEFLTWGPVSRATNKPDPRRRGLSFRTFVRQLKREGYAVEWRLLRGCDYGSPTSRRRLFLVARCDGAPIRWPVASHGKGRTEPWRTAAECIDFSLPCPSIFLSKDEARALGVKRPLVPNTMRRIARGVDRFVINAAQPFIVPVTHQGDARVHSIDEPMRTITGANRGEHALVSPYLVPMQRENRPTGVNEPLQTVTTQGNKFNLIAPTLIQVGYGERAGQAPRALDIGQPLGTVVAGGTKHALSCAFLAKNYGGHETPGSDLAAPIDTITETDHHALVAAHITKFRTGSTGSAMDTPMPTVTANSYIKRPGGAVPLGVVAAHLQRDFGESVGSDLETPMPTITGGGNGHAAIVASSLLHFNQHCDGRSLDDPIPTITSQGGKFAEVRAFLVAYYGTDQKTGNLKEPMPAVTPHDRFALVTVHGVQYAIVDIGMRMLTARELANAQGFPPTYVLEARLELVTKKGKTIMRVVSSTAQKEMVGNSVNPHVARALVLANLGVTAAKERAA